jgi:hypothetical protein
MELLLVVKACFALSALLGAGLLYVAFHQSVDNARARRDGRHDRRSRGRPGSSGAYSAASASGERSGDIGGK